MSGTGNFSTHHVPDDGTWYATGDTVRIAYSPAGIRIVKDPAGDHEVYSCRRATEYTGISPLLRVGLRRARAASAGA